MLYDRLVTCSTSVGVIDVAGATSAVKAGATLAAETGADEAGVIVVVTVVGAVVVGTGSRKRFLIATEATQASAANANKPNAAIARGELMRRRTRPHDASTVVWLLDVVGVASILLSMSCVFSWRYCYRSARRQGSIGTLTVIVECPGDNGTSSRAPHISTLS